MDNIISMDSYHRKDTMHINRHLVEAISYIKIIFTICHLFTSGIDIVSGLVIILLLHDSFPS